MRDSQRRYLFSGMHLSLPHTFILVQQAQESAHNNPKGILQKRILRRILMP